MSDDQYQRVMTVLSGALDLDPAKRAAFIEEACVGNSALKQRVFSLLADAERAKDLLPTDGTETLALKTDDHDAIPERIGPYRLLRRLGAGGMGEVFLAEQDPPLRRLVALKLIRSDLSATAFVLRFDEERRALALMNHESIAKVFDAGATSDERPYIAMEYVAGSPLDRFCDANRVELRARLEILCHVCRGVQHAHQKGVIHRDLKPSNVLVTVQDDRPIAKIIDFGVAKAFDPRLSDRPVSTVGGQIAGTPEYMSPEQTRLENRDIDTRTDVYSLGMILYLLLVDDFPYDFGALKRADGYEGIFRAIREVEPPPPSRRVASLIGRAGVKALSPAELRAKRKALSGELDWITLKALEKDPNLRYASPIDLAADIQRYLDDEPVSVGPPSVRYRLGKFVRRHRPQVAAAVLVGIAVLGGVVSTGIGFARAVRAEHVARDEAAHAAQEAEGAKRTKDLLVSVLKSPDPSVARGTTLDVRDILQRGTERVLAGLKDQPLFLAQMMDVIGLVDTNLGSYDEAKRLLTEALAIRRQRLNRHDPLIADSLDSVGHLDMETNHPEQALEVYKEGLSIREAAFARDDPRLGASLNNVGVALRDLEHGAEARPYLEKALDLRQRALPANDLRIAEGHMNLANVLSDFNLNAEALDHYQQALEMYKRLDPDNPDRATVLDNLGVLKATSQGVEGALPLHEQALTIRKKMLPPRHPDVAISLVNTANDLLELKRYAEARPDYEEAIAIYEARPELGRRNLGWAHGNLSSLLVATRQFRESQRHLQQAKKILVALDGADSSDLAEILEYRAGVMKDVGRTDDAAAAAAEAKRIREHLAKNPHR